MSSSPDVPVHPESRMQLERLLSGAGVSARTPLHSVSLSPPQPAVAAPIRGKRYAAQHQHLCRFKGSALTCSSCCAGYQLRASIYSYGPADSQPSPFSLDASIRSAEALSGTPNLLLLPFPLSENQPAANLKFESCFGKCFR